LIIDKKKKKKKKKKRNLCPQKRMPYGSFIEGDTNLST